MDRLSGGVLLVGLCFTLIGGVLFWSQTQDGVSTLITGLVVASVGFFVALRTEVFGGLLLLLGSGIAISAPVARWSEEPLGASLLLSGLTTVIIGFIVLSKRHDGKEQAAIVEPEEGLSERSDVGVKIDSTRVSSLDSPMFSIIEDVEDTVLDAIENLLKSDPRVEDIAADEGRYYSVPDGDDLPEWFALRVRCVSGTRDAVMKNIANDITAELGAEARSKVKIDYY